MFHSTINENKKKQKKKLKFIGVIKKTEEIYLGRKILVSLEKKKKRLRKN